jgi:hypothetical protein
MWIRVARGPSGPVAEGDLSGDAGHRIRLPDGGVDGIFAGWRWTGRALVIEQDRYGLYPLFEWTRGDTRVVSTSLVAPLEQGARRFSIWMPLRSSPGSGFSWAATRRFKAYGPYCHRCFRRAASRYPEMKRSTASSISSGPRSRAAFRRRPA